MDYTYKQFVINKDVTDMKKLGKFAALSLSGIVSLATFSNANATSYQIFTNIGFANPAALNSVKQGQFIIGGLTLASRFHFVGTAAGVSGSTTSRTDDFLPYGRIAMRFSPKWVGSVDITQPYYTDIQYPRNSFINAFATETFIRDTNYSPKLSYQATERLALGFGLDINNLYNGQLNFAVAPFGVMTNKADSWAYGWDAGLFYVITPATYLNLSYYSAIVHHTGGVSAWGPLVNNHLSADVKLPATTIVNLIQMLSPVWALSGTVRYSKWDPVRFTVLQNTAAGITITVPDHFYNNVSLEIATHYQVNQKWGVLGAIDYEPNIQPTYTRNPGLPTYNRFIPAVGAEYEITKGLKAKLAYAHVFSKPPINMSISTGQHIQGHDYLNVDAVDFSLNYDV
jgi:long-subunit fatty acid transport protein